MGKFKVVEKFISINGEAQCAGELACFIRFAGCNLNCSYCDTGWANEKHVPYEIYSEEELYAYIKACEVRNVTLTGGEPLLQENIGRLIRMLGKDLGLRTEIETNGSLPIEAYSKRDQNLSFTLDYKLPASGMESWMKTENYACLKPWDTVKFVISDDRDFARAREIITRYQLVDKCKVYLSTAFQSITPEEIVEKMIQYKMNGVRLQLQMHKYIWEPDRKGV